MCGFQKLPPGKYLMVNRNDECATFRGTLSTKEDVQAWLKSFQFDQWAVRKGFSATGTCVYKVNKFIGKLCCSLIFLYPK